MLLQNFDDVERLARALQQQEKGALEAAAAAQLRYVALREQMAAREQELVDEMLRKANAEHSDAAAAQTQLEQELQAQKLELKALEERDREEAKEKGLGKVVRSTKDAYWEEERAARDLEQKQSEIAAANKELQELQQKQAQLIASNEEELESSSSGRPPCSCSWPPKRPCRMRSRRAPKSCSAAAPRPRRPRKRNQTRSPQARRHQGKCFGRGRRSGCLSVGGGEAHNSRQARPRCRQGQGGGGREKGRGGARQGGFQCPA